MNTDAKQARLRVLFAELRRLKQEELPRRFDTQVERAVHEAGVRREIRRVERQIEEEMRRDG